MELVVILVLLGVVAVLGVLLLKKSSETREKIRVTPDGAPNVGNWGGGEWDEVDEEVLMANRLYETARLSMATPQPRRQRKTTARKTTRKSTPKKAARRVTRRRSY